MGVDGKAFLEERLDLSAGLDGDDTTADAGSALGVGVVDWTPVHDRVGEGWVWWNAVSS